jgi:hypothetical protein
MNVRLSPRRRRIILRRSPWRRPELRGWGLRRPVALRLWYREITNKVYVAITCCRLRRGLAQ